jgi:hypothetical protein
MRAHVYRHCIHEGRKVGAMIKVESPEKILVGFAAA